MKTRVQWKQAQTIVRRRIHEWDPYSLLAGGAPDDEFDSEIARVVAEIRRIKSRADATEAISRVFSSAFDPKDFSPERCSEVGSRLFDELNAAGLIEL